MESSNHLDLNLNWPTVSRRQSKVRKPITGTTYFPGEWKIQFLLKRIYTASNVIYKHFISI